MSAYSDAMTAAMTFLGTDERTMFLGQAVAYPGTAMSGTLSGVPDGKKHEMPVAEDMQMGMSIGLALQGFVPVSIYPRWNFMILAANQLVNHLDKLPLISGFRPKVIVRVGIGAKTPLDPGPQHESDFTDGFRAMLKTVPVVRLGGAEDILPAYRDALSRDGSTILVEHMDLYA